MSFEFGIDLLEEACWGIDDRLMSIILSILSFFFGIDDYDYGFVFYLF
jgi:hypothetical protein